MIRYLPRFVPDADTLLQWLLSNATWKEEWIKLFGKRHRVPRLVSWYGEPGASYRYSGVMHEADGWPVPLQPLRERLDDQAGFRSQFVLVNRYRDGQDAMGWHRDDEPGIGQLVASVSLGAERRFHIEHPDGTRETLWLEHGSLLIMPGKWRHQLPRTRKPIGERVNLSFRTLSALEHGAGI